METPNTSWFINTLSKSQILVVLRQNFNLTVDEDLSVEQLRELLQAKISAAKSPFSQIVSESQPDAISCDDTPVLVNAELESAKPKSSTVKVKSVSKSIMSDAKIEFHLKADNWDTFVERMELYFDANDIPPEKWVAEILTKVSTDAYELIRNLATPKKPKELTFDELVKLVSDHLDPKPTEMVQRDNFSKARQYPNESVSDFVARLKKLSLNCNYTDLEMQLRDRFVSGIKSEDAKAEMFLQKELTFQSAVEIAKAREQATSNAAHFSGGRGRGRGGPHHHSRGGRGGHHNDGGAPKGHNQQGQNNVGPAPVPQNIVYNVIGHATQNRGGGLKIQNRGNVTHKKRGGNPPQQQDCKNTGGKPKGDKPKGDKPKGDKPKGNKPKSDKPEAKK